MVSARRAVWTWGYDESLLVSSSRRDTISGPGNAGCISLYPRGLGEASLSGLVHSPVLSWVLADTCSAFHVWWTSFLRLAENHYEGHEVQLGNVIHLQRIPIVSIIGDVFYFEVLHLLLCHPLKLSNREWLNHRPAIKIISIQINNVRSG